MKELSIEEKARSYDEAKYIMKEYLESGNAGVIAENTIKKAFPELSESEDERIRKKLLEYFKSFTSETFFCGVPTSDAIAWLEKHGEQKPDTNCLLSWSETDEKMFQSLEGIVKDYWAKAEQEKNEIKIREASNVSYFLKTIQKSPLCWIKCSDGLPNRDGIYLVVTDGLHNEVYDMARYDSIEGWHKASEIIYWMPIPQLNNKNIIEQKPADKAEPKFRVKYAGSEYNVLEVKDIAGVTYYGIEDEPNHIDYVQAENCERVGGYSIKENGSPYPTKPAVFSEQKPAWSEEDNEHLERILKELKNQWQRPLNRPYLEEIESDYNWLNSLKDRVQPQPKQEWSEEDKEYINDLIGVFDGQQYQAHSDEEIVKWLKSIRLPYNKEWDESDEEMLRSIVATCELAEQEHDSSPARHLLEMQLDWLKSLRPQNRWKPNKEQMEALLSKLPIIKGSGDEVQDILESLYQDLEKLREK